MAIFLRYILGSFLKLLATVIDLIHPDSTEVK